MNNLFHKTIIFDLGGVYLNRGIWIAEEIIAKKFNLVLGDVKESMIRKHYTNFFTGQISEKEYWQRCMRDWDIQTDFWVLRNIVLRSFRPQPGMPELVDRLRDNYQVGLLSDQSKEWWSALDKKYKISRKFSFCIVSAEVGLRKPDPKIYQLILDRTSIDAQKIVYIDDLEKSLHPAIRLGMKVILFQNLSQLKKDLFKIGVRVEG